MVMPTRPPSLPPPFGAIIFVIGFIIVTRKSKN